MTLPNPESEARRVQALQALQLHEAPSDGVLDGLVRATASLLGVRSAMINFIDTDRQWSQAHSDLAANVPRQIAFCDQTILGESLFEVSDATQDMRFSCNPLVTGEPHLRFYAGVPIGVDGQNLGALCVIDTVPRQLLPEQRTALKDMAHAVNHWLLSRQEHLLRLTQAEAASARLEQHVAQRTEQLERARRYAEDANAAKSTFLATMSHEIRTPMNGVLGVLELLERTQLSDEQRQLLQTMQGSAQTLLSLIDDLLDFAKIEAGRLELHASPSVLRALIVATVDSLQPMASLRQVKLHTKLESTLPTSVKLDAMRLRQILANLMGNAIKFSAGQDRSGEVWVTARPVGADRWELCVQDNGVGIAPDVLPRLFEPFAQATAHTATNFGGTGLGLAICRRLVDAMGGCIQITSEPGQGTRVCVSLPMEAADFTPLASGAQSGQPDVEPSANAPLAWPGMAPLLVAEDNATNRWLIEHQLSELDVPALLVADGDLAIQAWNQRQGDFSLVLTDLNMPGLDGYALTQAIRLSAHNPTVPVIALTANALRGEHRRCLDAGMSDHISKPVSLAALEGSLRHWLQAPQRTAPHADAPPLNPDATLTLTETGEEPDHDPQALTRFIGEDPMEHRVAHQLFHRSLTASQHEFEDALRQQNWPMVADIAHRLKSSARAVGALRLARALDQTEHAARAAQTDRVHSLHRSLPDHVRAFEVAIGQRFH